MLTLGMQGRKWDIFLSAVDLFADRGYENVSMRDIAAVNDVRASSIYNYFPSKESILEQIYRFFNENTMDVAPDLDKVLAAIPEKSPREVLHMTMSYYGADLQPIMDKIYQIAIMQAHRDERAYTLIWETSLEHSKTYLRAVLEKMIRVGQIEDLDVESFMDLFVSFGFTAVFRNRTPKALGITRWLNGLDMLFSLLKERSPASV